MLVATAAFWSARREHGRSPLQAATGLRAWRRRGELVGVGMRFFEPSPARSSAERARPVVLVAVPARTRDSRAASGAHTVELMADFTDWEPVTLSPGAAGSSAFTLGSGHIASSYASMARHGVRQRTRPPWMMTSAGVWDFSSCPRWAGRQAT